MAPPSMASEAEPQAQQSSLEPTPFRASMWLTRCCPFAGMRGRRHKKPVPEIPSMPDVSGSQKAVASNALAIPAPVVALPSREAFVEPAPPSVQESLDRRQAITPEVPVEERLPEQISARNREKVDNSLVASERSGETTTRPTGFVPLIEQFEARNVVADLQGSSSRMPRSSIGTTAGDPATEPPCWWVGKDPVPMELLEDTAELLPVSSADIESLLPPLPNLRPQWIATTHSSLKASPERSSSPRRTESMESNVDEEVSEPQQAPPVVRPRSYRNSEKGVRRLREEGVHRGTTSSPEIGQVGHLGSSVSSSRPTTAGAETASTYSTSWREEWTPGSKPVEKHTNVGFAFPGPLTGARPPPLPPLPSKPPEQGSLSLQTPVDEKQVVSPLGTSTGTYRANDDALRRICQSNAAKVATPPPLSWGRLGSPQVRTSESSDSAINLDKAAPTVESTKGVLKPSPAPCLNEDDEEINGVEFSELACAFATLE